MKLQPFEQRNAEIREAFEVLKREHPERVARRIDMSFMASMFGLEPTARSIERLASLGYKYVELPGCYGGAHYGDQLKTEEIKKALADTGMRCSGVCSLSMEGFSLYEKSYFSQGRAAEFITENVKYCKAVGGAYYLTTVAPIGRDYENDSGEYDRSVAALRAVADVFVDCGIVCAIEPVNYMVSSFCRTVAEAKQFIVDVNHPGVQHIYGDTEHLMIGEPHWAGAVLDAGKQLKCLHLRDSAGGRAIGSGMLDLDTLIMALYLIGFNSEGHFAVGEPFAGAYLPRRDVNFYAVYPEEIKLRMARENIEYFKAREAELFA